MTKRILALILGCSLLLSLSAPAFAAEEADTPEPAQIMEEVTEQEPLPEPEETSAVEPQTEETPVEESEPEEESAQEPEKEPAQEPEEESPQEPEEETPQEPASEEEQDQMPETEADPELSPEPHPVCEGCGVELTGDAVHKDDCPAMESPQTAQVYTEEEGIYQELPHSEAEALPLEKLDGRTLYVLSSEKNQNLYFSCKSLLGHKYTLSESEFARLTAEDGIGVVTLAAQTPADTAVTLTAHLLLTHYSVTIQVLDHLPEMPPEELPEGETGREVTLEGKTFSSETELTVASVSEETWNAMRSAGLIAASAQNQHLFAFEITAQEAATIRLQGLVDQVHARSVTMVHLLDDPAAIAALLPDGTCPSFPADPADFPKETAAAAAAGGGENRVYYQIQTLPLHSDGSVTFDADSFSTFLFVVNFLYEGKTYALEANGSVYLSELLESLGITQTAADVSFSDPSLVSIQQEGEDFLLTSLQPFSTEEFLTVTLQDGQTIVIRVIDPVYHYYLWDNNGANKDGHVMWNEGTQQRTVNGVSRHTNGAILTAREVYDRANTDPGVDIQIYARPGMAIGFTRGTVWAETGGNGWSRYWDADAANGAGTGIYWAILDNVSSVTEITFSLTASTDGGFVSWPTPAGYSCKVKIVVIPNVDAVPDSGTIRMLPITLYDYDGAEWNSHYGGKNAATPFLAFAATVQGESVDNYPNPRYGANTGGTVAIMGILQDKLGSNDLPVMAGNYQQVDLFSTNGFSGKTVYENVQFPFLYDESTGYYRYDSSKNHAQLNAEGTALTLYNRALSHGYESGTKGGLYPFNQISDAELLPDGNYALDPVSSTSVRPASRMNMHLGLQLAASFYLPQDRLSNADEEMVYEFVGDDDLWVFLDDQLVLDIGGGHTPVSGRINITTGAWYVSSGRNLGSSSSRARSGQFDVNTTDAFRADAMHTLRIFYLERHSGESNCMMQFNLPIAPANSLTITKKLVNQDGESLSITPDTAYTFTVEAKADTEDYAPLNNAVYTILGDSSQQVYQTDEHGQFQLKSGQSAQFTGIPRFTWIRVKEERPADGYVYLEDGEHPCVSGSTGTGGCGYGQFTNPVEMRFAGVRITFTNFLQTQPLTVEKQVVGGAEGLLNPQQNFTFDLTFTKNCLPQSTLPAEGDVTSLALEVREGYLGGEFLLAQGQHLTIPAVPVNMTYQLLEENPDSLHNSFDAPVFRLNALAEETVPFDTCFGGTEGKEILDWGENRITVKNQQFFDLILTKRGISQGDGDQSTLYEVTGPVQLLVTIGGNQQAVIQRLPVGRYTVTERTDWSWRYASANAEQTVTPDAFRETRSFTNIRQVPQWLSGDCYAENLWTQNGITKREIYQNPEI